MIFSICFLLMDLSTKLFFKSLQIFSATSTATSELIKLTSKSYKRSFTSSSVNFFSVILFFIFSKIVLFLGFFSGGFSFTGFIFSLILSRTPGFFSTLTSTSGFTSSSGFNSSTTSGFSSSIFSSSLGSSLGTSSTFSSTISSGTSSSTSSGTSSGFSSTSGISIFSFNS